MAQIIAVILKKEITMPKAFERILMVGLFSYLTFTAGLIKIYIPGTPVPFTMQTFVLFIAAYYLSAKENGISQIIYVVAGMLGAPVFAAGLTGALALVGPTAGYLAGFVISGILISFIIRKAGRMNYFKATLIFALGSLIILTLGMLHLVLGYRMTLSAAFCAGFLPFSASEAAKIILAAGLYGIKR